MDIPTTKIRIVPKNPMTVTSQKKQKRTLPLLPSNLVSLLPSVGVLEGIRMDKGWKREVEALETNKVD